MKEFEVLAVWLVFLLFWFFYFCVCLWFLLVFILVFFRVFCLLGILCTIKKVYGFVGNFPKFTLRQMSIRKFPWPNRLTKQIPQKDIWDTGTQQALFILWWYCLWSCMDHLLLSFPGEPWEPRLSFVLQDAGSHPGNEALRTFCCTQPQLPASVPWINTRLSCWHLPNQSWSFNHAQAVNSDTQEHP